MFCVARRVASQPLSSRLRSNGVMPILQLSPTALRCLYSTIVEPNVPTCTSTRPPIVFDIGYAAKGKVPRSKHQVPVPHDAGEDAFFMTDDKRTLGVLDGVGGWKSFGVDPAEFSWRMALNSKEFAEMHPSWHPKTVMQAAYQKILDNKEVFAGSSTACLVNLQSCFTAMDIRRFIEHKSEQEAGVRWSPRVCPHSYKQPSGSIGGLTPPMHAVISTADKQLLEDYLTRRPGVVFLHSANIGDSGFFLYRPSLGTIVYRSRDVVHRFNAPFQLARIPGEDELAARSAVIPIRMQGYSDSPEEADCMTIEAHVGDIVVMGTDGLFDNLYMPDMVRQIEHFFQETFYMESDNPEDMWDKMEWAASSKVIRRCLRDCADSILKDAQQMSRDTLYASPFAMAAREAGYQYAGGKPDDTTVIVAMITYDSKKKSHDHEDESHADDHA